MKKRTKPISAQEYAPVKLFDKKEEIKRLANLEAEVDCKIAGETFTPASPLPHFEEIKVRKNEPGWMVFALRAFLP